MPVNPRMALREDPEAGKTLLRFNDYCQLERLVSMWGGKELFRHTDVRSTEFRRSAMRLLERNRPTVPTLAVMPL